MRALALVVALTSWVRAGVFVVQQTGDGTGNGTLRWAINSANSSPGPDTVLFDTTGLNASGARIERPNMGEPAWVIQVDSQLPSITEQAFVCGFVNENSTPDIVIRPISSVDTGLRLLANHVEIAGLIIQGFNGPGIYAEAESLLIRGCFSGTSPDGETGVPNRSGLVARGCKHLVIEDCVCSGNAEHGLAISASARVQMRDLRVGVGYSGSPLANTSSGLYLRAVDSSQILNSMICWNGREGVFVDDSCDVIDLQNLNITNNTRTGLLIDTACRWVNPESCVISLNGRHGVLIRKSMYCQIKDSWIGTGQDTLPAGNGACGVVITDSAINNGITNSIVANNSDCGVVIGISPTDFYTVNNRLHRCLIYQNNNLDIDLGGDGVNTNDPGDADQGPNHMINYPVFDSVKQVASGRWVVYGRGPEPGEIAIFLSDQHPSQHGGGRALLSIDTTVVLPEFVDTIDVDSGQAITSIFTDLWGNSSEFSNNLVIGTGVKETRSNPSEKPRISMGQTGIQVLAEKGALIRCYNGAGALVWQGTSTGNWQSVDIKSPGQYTVQVGKENLKVIWPGGSR